MIWGERDDLQRYGARTAVQRPGATTFQKEQPRSLAASGEAQVRQCRAPATERSVDFLFSLCAAEGFKHENDMS